MILKKFISIALYFIYIFSFGQKIESEEFNSKFLLNNKYGELIYCGDNKHFVVKFFGKKIQKEEIEGRFETIENQHFISVDQTIIQSLIIPIPNDLRKANPQEAESILNNYLHYELAHLSKELKLNISDALSMPGSLKSRKYILWKYKMSDYTNVNDGETVKGQIYLSTICFNQILTLNIPIIDFSLENKYRRKLVNMARHITMHDNSCEK